MVQDMTENIALHGRQLQEDLGQRRCNTPQRLAGTINVPQLLCQSGQGTKPPEATVTGQIGALILTIRDPPERRLTHCVATEEPKKCEAAMVCAILSK